MIKTAPHNLSCVAIAGRGLLIAGASGSGKSSLALALIDRGAILVGDDGVMLSTENGYLIASPEPRIEGLLEIRNIGLVKMAVCRNIPVALLLRLERDAPRYIEQAASTIIETILVPSLSLWPDSPVLALRAEWALERYGLTPRR